MKEQRQIKFRAWDGFKMIPPEGVTIWNGLHWHPVRDCEIVGYPLMQFTGLLDRHGKEIYEGDIIMLKSYSFQHLEKDYYEVYYHNESARFKVNNRMPYPHDYDDDFDGLHSFEIIGNIYQDSHLLKS